MHKCLGCGSLLQSIDSKQDGYTKDLTKDFCERCFRIKHYDEYKLVSKSNDDYLKILKNINKTDSLVILVVDLFNIPKSLNVLKKYINNKILLVLTKRDLLPLSVYDANLLEYFKKYDLNIVDSIIVSSKNNYHFDLLMDKISSYQTDKNVYVVGFTNAGKSTLINKMLYNYTDEKPVITTSYLPSTTIDSITISLSPNLVIIDTPGLLEEGNIIDYLDVALLKKIVPKNEIRPKVYQIKSKQIIFIDDLVRIECEGVNSLVFYIANTLNVERTFKDIDRLITLAKHDISVQDNQDIVISGLGFIKVVNKAKFKIYTLNGVDVYVRDALI